ncbi:hypothetical protein DICVIV_12705 [Dictyocaulus viviparus]|uniref:G domain-containing protein n=1 Tax=Dictyocaulus viviparus TaxID=29172 RepID=A0A0D8XG24_DICVI|nr:hypothetical protein DICVIV_12705 [Dictyocaulus viviparus]
MLMRRIYMIDCPGVVYPQGDSETQIILKGVVRVENVKDPENHVQGVLDRVKFEHLRNHYGIDEWKNVEDFMTKIAIKQGRLLKGGEPDITAIAKCVLNDFQRGKLPYFAVPPNCVESLNKDYGVVMKQACPTNDVCLSDARNEFDPEKDNNEMDSTSLSGADCDEAVEEADDDLTDVGSLCSGLSDLSGVSDLDEHFDDSRSDEENENKTSEGARMKGKRSRGIRAGRKHGNKRLLGAKTVEETGAQSSSQLVEFEAKDLNSMKNMLWRKKLRKKRKIKHQQ